MKRENQKLKTLFIRDILFKYTDEEHPLTVAQIIDMLYSMGVTAERKSVYNDLTTLANAGLDIVKVKGKNTGYYIGQRSFELAELKLLSDAVAVSRFITQKKSDQLIEKIESLASVYQADTLARQVFIDKRPKTSNEKIFYNIDIIYQAISKKLSVAFHYFDYSLNNEKVYRGDGDKYKAIPYALTWDDEKYYMIAYYEKYGGISHFRVDKMDEISLSKESTEKPFAIDLVSYCSKIFNMFSGEETIVKILFDNKLLGAVRDRFGSGVVVSKYNEGSFTAMLKVAASPAFIGWMLQFGDSAKVLEPESLVSEIKKVLAKLSALYGADKEHF